MPDLSHESLAARDGGAAAARNASPDAGKPDLSDAAFPAATEGPKAPAPETPESELERLQELRMRQVRHMESGSGRLGLGGDDIELLVRAAHRVRDGEDQGQAPPVDHDLVYRATWDLLPHEEALRVQLLGIMYKTWGMALLAEVTRRGNIERAAENN